MFTLESYYFALFFTDNGFDFNGKLSLQIPLDKLAMQYR